MNTAGAATNDTSEIDREVALARQICERHAAQGGLPDKSALHTLARFANWTSSVPELVLFVQYQGARRTAKDQDDPAAKNQGAFFSELAGQIDQVCNGDIERARRVLGFVVRAGTVMHAGSGKDSKAGTR